jgi:helix-turn-helix protein
MDRPQVGAALRRARERREVELAEVEAATKIRLRFLRAIESEEWEALPGGVYTRGFIRTYAALLGLDGDRLAEDYRSSVEGPSATAPSPAPAQAKPPQLRRRRPLLSWVAAIGAVALIAFAVLVLLPSGGNGGGEDAAAPAGGAHSATAQGPAATKAPEVPSGISLSLVAGAEVWVCLLDERGEPLVDGQILAAGTEAGPFRSGSFTVSFGNGEVAMTVDGKQAEIPATPSPVGYSIDGGGSLTELGEAERPTCS